MIDQLAPRTLENLIDACDQMLATSFSNFLFYGANVTTERLVM